MTDNMIISHATCNGNIAYGKVSKAQEKSYKNEIRGKINLAESGEPPIFRGEIPTETGKTETATGKSDPGLKEFRGRLNQEF